MSEEENETCVSVRRGSRQRVSLGFEGRPRGSTLEGRKDPHRAGGEGICPQLPATLIEGSLWGCKCPSLSGRRAGGVQQVPEEARARVELSSTAGLEPGGLEDTPARHMLSVHPGESRDLLQIPSSQADLLSFAFCGLYRQKGFVFHFLYAYTTIIF